MMCTSYALVVLFSSVVLIDGNNNGCMSIEGQSFQSTVELDHNNVRKSKGLPQLNYNCELEKLAVEYVLGCPPTPPESYEADINFMYVENSEQGSMNVSHLSLMRQTISSWQNRDKERSKMQRPDIGSVGCAIAKCSENEGMVHISVACFYGKVEERLMESMIASTTEKPLSTNSMNVESSSVQPGEHSLTTTTTAGVPAEEELKKSTSKSSSKQQESATSSGVPSPKEEPAASTIASITEKFTPETSSMGELATPQQGKTTGNVAVLDWNGQFSTILITSIMLKLLA
ncbi:hypothetical protein KIN20_017859 [Parelaphostrongylus tenuis]|uniref:SCP domain-containing protein n=1 Tax=Parelaphostrongylus tenuis TaxID=148309 RepID=A0AAD5N1B2_PARTN|nr:hypothetical protein KIN20_017859 [Parelaphostrongylus tenuis]